MRIAKRQLKRIIREETSKLRQRPLNEVADLSADLYDILADVAVAFENQNVEALERLKAEFDEMPMDANEAGNYKMALQAMIDATYKLKDLDYQY